MKHLRFGLRWMFPLTIAVLLFVGCGEHQSEVDSLVSQIEAAGRSASTQSDYAPVRKVVERLGEIGAPAVPALIEALGRHPEPESRLLLEALAKIGDAAVVPLNDAIDNNNPRVRRGAIEAIYLIRKQGQADVTPALPKIRAAAKDPDEEVREATVSVSRVLLQEDAAPLLIEALKDSSVKVRRTAATLLGSGGLNLSRFSEAARAEMQAQGLHWPIPHEAIEPLINALDDEDKLVRQNAALVLGKIGPEAGGAIPRLARLLEADPGFEYTQALARMGPDAVGPLRELIHSKNHDVVVRALDALRQMAHSNSQAMDALIAALKDEDTEIRVVAAYKIGWLKRQGEAALPALRGAQQDSSESVRRNATWAISQIESRPAAKASQ